MNGRPGVIMLEVMVALALLAAAGLTLLTLAGENGVAIQRAERSGREAQRASDFLATVALWSSTDLNRRLGTRRQGPWLLRIERESEGLYSVALLDTLAERPLLETSFFKPATAR